jgi:hypothetical protein
VATLEELAAARGAHEAGKVFEVIAWREPPWWVLHVPEVGATQVRFLVDAEYMARDLIACMLDVDYHSVRVRVVRGIGPVQDAGSRSLYSWFWATVYGVRDRARRLLADRAGQR